jgi:hypothetical protein
MIKAHVYVGMTAWAAYGDTRWSAIRVLKVGREFARVERVRPKTGEVVTRKAKARIVELVKRDPKLVGADKPQDPPSVVFQTDRARREDAQAVKEVPPPPAPTPEPPPQRKRGSRPVKWEALMDELWKASPGDW